GRIPEIEKLLESEQNRLGDLQKDGVFLKEEVDEEDVAQIVAKWTGVPVSKMLEGEMQKLVAMEENLRRRVIGKEEALKTWQMQCAARVPGSKTRTAPLARSSSLARRAWARPRRHARWQN